MIAILKDHINWMSQKYTISQYVSLSLCIDDSNSTTTNEKHFSSNYSFTDKLDNWIKDHLNILKNLSLNNECFSCGLHIHSSFQIEFYQTCRFRTWRMQYASYNLYISLFLMRMIHDKNGIISYFHQFGLFLHWYNLAFRLNKDKYFPFDGRPRAETSFILDGETSPLQYRLYYIAVRLLMLIMIMINL